MGKCQCHLRFMCRNELLPRVFSEYTGFPLPHRGCPQTDSSRLLVLGPAQGPGVLQGECHRGHGTCTGPGTTAAQGDLPRTSLLSVQAKLGEVLILLVFAHGQGRAGRDRHCTHQLANLGGHMQCLAISCVFFSHSQKTKQHHAVLGGASPPTSGPSVTTQQCGPAPCFLRHFLLL